MNKDWVVFQLREALAEIELALSMIEDDGYEDERLRVDMYHIYHHLNTAWNSRNVGGSPANCPEDEFYARQQFPTDLSMSQGGLSRSCPSLLPKYHAGMEENPYRAPESVDKPPPPVRWGLRLWLSLVCYLAAAFCQLFFFDLLHRGDFYYAVLSIIALVGFACFGYGLPLNRKHHINIAFILILIVLVGSLGRAGVSYLTAR